MCAMMLGDQEYSNLLSTMRNDVGRSRILQTCSATRAMMWGDREYCKLAMVLGDRAKNATRYW